MTIVYIDDDLDNIDVFQEAIEAIDSSLVIRSFSNLQTAVDWLEVCILKPDINILW